MECTYLDLYLRFVRVKGFLSQSPMQSLSFVSLNNYNCGKARGIIHMRQSFPARYLDRIRLRSHVESFFTDWVRERIFENLENSGIASDNKRLKINVLKYTRSITLQNIILVQAKSRLEQNRMRQSRNSKALLHEGGRF